MNLSICIPTFNRCQLLEQLLDSIASACPPESVQQIEICISDNASTDGTEQMVRDWSWKTKIRVVYERGEENKGADWNFIKAPSLASGDYIWLMGSDDFVLASGIKTILSAMDSHADIYLGGRLNYDLSLMNLSFQENFVKRAMLFDLSDRGQMLDYLENCSSLGGLFSYLSSIVVNTQGWKRHLSNVEQSFGTAYAHAFVLCKLAFNGAKVETLDVPIVKNRGGNDFFEGQGSAERVLIDLRGYLRIADSLHVIESDAQVRQAFYKVIKRERPLVHTAFYLRQHGNSEQWNRSKPLLKRLGAPVLFLFALESFPWIIKFAHSTFVRQMGRRLLARNAASRNN
jgi:abequosyltransferase